MPWVFQEDPKVFNRYLQGNKTVGQWIAALGDLLDEEIDNVELCLILTQTNYMPYYRLLLSLREAYQKNREAAISQINRGANVSDSQEVSGEVASEVRCDDEPSPS